MVPLIPVTNIRAWLVAATFVLLAAACTCEVEVPVDREVIREVPVERVVEVEKIV